MPLAPSNGIEIFYETFGSKDDPTILMVMGFGAQMIVWPEAMIEDLVRRGFHVVIFDNRDCGLSTKSTEDPPDIGSLYMQALSGEAIRADQVAYSLSDMAADSIGLIDHLEIDLVHLVGASMGGMIVQTLAIEHSERLLSATSIMSSTGEMGVGGQTPEALMALLGPAPSTRDEILAQRVSASQLFSGPLWDRDRAEAAAELSFDRSFHPIGSTFQFAAIGATGDRTESLGSVDLPFLVIHGNNDSLIDVSGGHATAAAIPGADLLILDVMGHDLPPQLIPQINGAIAVHIKRAQPGEAL